VQVVQAAYAAFGRADIAALLELLTDDVEWFEPGPLHVLPWAGRRRGREQVGEFFRAIDQALEFEAFEPREFIAQGDTVVVLGMDRSRLKSTGRRVETEWAMAFTIRDGKIARLRECSDTAPMLAAIRDT
jgi:ketosteroid isomerase-like protein